MLDRANNFYNSYKTDESTNLGINIHLLNLLSVNKFIKFVAENQSPREFISLNKDLFKSINPLNFIDSNNKFDYAAYLNAVDTENVFEVSNEINEQLTDFFENNKNAQDLQKNFKTIGFEEALLFDLNIPSGRADWKNKSDELKRKNVTGAAYHEQLDHTPHGASWPYTPIKGSNIFAFQGFSEKGSKDNKEFDEAGFFYEILNNKLDLMIALGVAGVDFPGYFFINDTYIKKNEKGEVILKVSVDLKESKMIYDDICQYTIKCDFEIYNPETQKMENKTHTFNVVNIPIEDGLPLKFESTLRFNLLSHLLGYLNHKKNVGVHCRAGRGRTGELVAELFAMVSKQYNDFFSDEIRDNILSKIRKFVADFRDQNRAGSMLRPLQISQFLINIQEFLLDVEKIMTARKQQAQDKNNSETEKKQKINEKDSRPVKKRTDPKTEHEIKREKQGTPFLFTPPPEEGANNLNQNKNRNRI